MSRRDGMSLLGAAGHLPLGVLSLVRGRRSPLARPLALLCLDMFGWCFGPLAFHVTGMRVWNGLDAICTAMSPPLALHLVVTFVGAGRAKQRVVATAYVAFGALAVSSGAGCGAAWGRAWLDSRAWAAVFLAGWAPTLILLLVLLVRHLLAAIDPDEKARTRLMLAALAVGGALATADVVSVLGISIP